MQGIRDLKDLAIHDVQPIGDEYTTPKMLQVVEVVAPPGERLVPARESGPLKAVRLSRHKWPGGLVN